MANEVSPFGGSVNVAAAADVAKRIGESAQNDPRGSAPGDSLYLNFSGKRGLYSIGPENRAITPKELWAVNIASFEDGWICWKGGRPAGKRMANIFTGVPVSTPDPDEGGPFDTKNGEGWHQAKALIVKSLDCDEQGYFSTNSKSGVSAVAGLQKEIAERSASGQAAWPLVHMDMVEFSAQGHKNFAPKFVVYGWIDDANLAKLNDPECDIDELIAASSNVTELPDGGGEAEAEAEETTGRRRRRL